MQITFTGRSPHGERGLKSSLLMDTVHPAGSLPPRGAWIEITCPAILRCVPQCRSPHGERGLKSKSASKSTRAASRSPRGEGGLKSWANIFPGIPDESLPPRGAWIEMLRIRHRWKRTCRRSPHGERGLKS